jgi:hypothetical protein
MAKKPHIKPAGTIGSLSMKSGPDIDEKVFSRDISPGKKDENEQIIAEAFKLTLEKILPGKSIKLTQLEENDLDYELDLNGEISKIEFTELVLKYPPYKEIGDTAIIHYKDWSDKFSKIVETKNTKLYQVGMPIDLLVYTTHFAYVGNDFCITLAREYLRHYGAGKNFRNIYYLDFLGEASKLFVMKPYAEKLKPSLRQEYEKQWYMNANLGAGTPVPGGVMFKGIFPT